MSDDKSEKHFPHCNDDIAEAIHRLSHALRESNEVSKALLLWLQSQRQGVTHRELDQLKERIMATQAEEAERVRQLTAQIGSVGADIDELVEKVRVLEEAAANQPNATPELTAAIDGLKTSIQTADDKYVNPNAPAPPGNQPLRGRR